MRPLARSSSIGILLVAGAVLQSPAAAENPKLSLRVQNATAVEAAAQLTKAAGVPIEIQVPALPAGVQPSRSHRLLQEKANFDWNGKTLAMALRDLSSKFELRPSRRSGGYLLFPGGAPPPAPEKKIGAAEQQGVKLSVRRVTVRNNRSLDFSGGAVAQDDQALTLELHADLGDGDSDLIAGVENVVAMDDRGNLLVSERVGGRVAGVTLTGSLFPDEWASAVTLNGAHPRSSRLVWLEGDLIAYGGARMQPVEAPLPLPAGGFKKNVGEVVAEVLQFDPGSSGSGPVVSIRVQFPVGAPGAANSQEVPVPLLVGASGDLYTPTTTTQSTRRLGGSIAYEITGRFAATPDAPKTVRVNVVERKEPRRLFNFRVQDVPLPVEGTFVPRRTAVATPSAIRPFHQAGGGTLITSVKINDQAPPEGLVAIGLARKTGPDAGSVRWFDAPVEKDGTVKLPELSPGKYRLLRTFLPRQDLRLAGAGRWQNNEVDVTVEAGQETEVAPLQWKVTAEAPEAKPASAEKPAVEKPAAKKPPVKKPVRKKPVPKKR